MKRLRILCLALVLLILSACGISEGVSAPQQSQQPQDETVGTILDTTQDAEDVADAAEDVADDVEQATDDADEQDPSQSTSNTALPVYGEYYYDLDNVVLYLELYDRLPDNYITKSEARKLGWEGGSVEDYLEGAAIGGDRFGNREGLLPEAEGRSYTECDIDTNGYGSRGARRLVFSNDGLYFYTSDHYESFSEVTVTEDYEVIR